MLKAVKIKNFIHFKDEHLLRFEKGSYFFIGGNHTGKTSLYEAIRRCMSLSKSNGISNAHDPEKLSYITCEYETSEGIASSTVLRLPNPDTRDSDQGFLKFVFNPNKNCVHADLAKKNKHGKLVCEPLHLEPMEKIACLNYQELNFHDGIFSTLNVSENKSRLNHFMRKENVGKYIETDCETFLKTYVDDHAVIIFPFRSISPFESTITEARPKKRRGQIATKVSKRADILKWYLDQSEKGNISESERNREERIFNIITDNSGFQFRLDDGIISVKHTNNRKRKSDAAPMLLKIPEGIYEAKVLSVLFAVHDFKTVCLDDAERGMHPQMIERIRDHVLMDVQDKVILLITHHPSYITRWNIPRLFLFQRVEEDDDDVRFEINSLSVLFGSNVQGQAGACGTRRAGSRCPEMSEKTFQLITEDNVATLFFARRVLFVEGKSDKLFISAFLKHLTNNKELLRRFIEQDSADVTQNFVYFLSGLHIIALHGSPNIYKLHPLCRQLNIRHCMILDYDVLSQNLDDETEGERNIDKFCNKLPLSISASERDSIHEFGQVELFESKDLFIWSPQNSAKQSQQCKKGHTSGKIEGAVQSVFKSKQDQKHLNNCLTMKKKKLLLDKDVKYEHVNEATKRCAELAAKDKSSDFNRLVKFFFRMSQRNGRR